MMELIDRNGSRPVCAACHKAAKEYGIVVRLGRVYVCETCLRKPSLFIDASRFPAVKPKFKPTARWRKYAERTAV